MTYIIIIGFIQAFFFAVLALAKKNKEKADYYVAALFILLCYQLGVNYIIASPELWDTYVHFIGTSGPMTLLYGPLLFFFIKNFISKNQKFKTKYWIDPKKPSQTLPCFMKLLKSTVYGPIETIKVVYSFRF